MVNIIHVVGARPNFMKAAPVIRAIKKFKGIKQILVHTGQHYDRKMSEIFFDQLDIPKPDVNLGVGSGSHASQTADIMKKFEETVLEKKPKMIIVYGDVNSTVAAALVGTKLSIKIAHVEAGLRSNDRTMPEEINRLVTDSISDLLLTPSMDGDENLIHEGVEKTKINFVGNVMIDTLVYLKPKAEKVWPKLNKRLKLPKKYGLITLHRPSNVDEPKMLRTIIKHLIGISKNIPLIFPVHPRTLAKLKDLKMLNKIKESQIELIDPQGYLEFLMLQKHSQFVLTDSGGIQEETTYLKVPCLTLRENTERPITITQGTNKLIGHDFKKLKEEVKNLEKAKKSTKKPPKYWDGKASERIAKIVDSNLSKT